MATARTNGDDIDFKADIDSLKADISALAGDLKKLASRETNRAYDRVKGAAADAKDSISEGADKGGSLVSERPLASLVVAFLGGILLGKLTSR